jgi:hypothetical protein
MTRIFHIVFWFATFIVLTILLGPSYGGYAQSFYFVSFLFPVILGTSVMFNSFLVPKYLLQKKYVKFALNSLYTIIFSVYLEILVMTLALVVFANYQYEQMNPKTTDILLLTVVMYLLVLTNTIMLLLQEYFKGQNTNTKLKSEQERMRKGLLIVKSDRKNISLDYKTIVFIESVGNYVKIHSTSGTPIMTKERISAIEERLPNSFVRIHRSIVVNMDHVTSFNRELVQLQDLELPISRKYKEAVHDFHLPAH